MRPADLALVALNALTFLVAFVGIADANMDALLGAAFLTLLTAAVNGVVIFRRRGRAPAPQRARSADEMDARTVLELDERLQDLERREREVADAERIRDLMARGEQSAPTQPLPTGGGAERERETA